MPKPRKSSHVPAQYYGYSLQCSYCLHVLLDAEPGSLVSVEVLDDVAIEQPSGDVIAAQIKSASGANPISNRSPELWKTFANWVASATGGELNPGRTTFHLRLGRHHRGKICESFAAASGMDAAERAVKEAKREFYTLKAGVFKKGVPVSLQEILVRVFSPPSARLLNEIIARFQVSFGSAYAYEEMLARLKTKFIEDQMAQDVLLHALGWVKKRIDGAIERHEPAVIACDDFRAEIVSFRTRLAARQYLPSLSGQFSPADIESLRPRTFVQQLGLIKSPEERILGSITDFLTAKSDRVRYAKRGLVHTDSFVEFETALQWAWKNHRDEIELDSSREEVTRGQLLVFRCLRENFNLQGVAVNPAFIRGTFHKLADRPSIGWHPRYEELLRASGEK